MNEPIKLVPGGRPDVDIAKDLKARIEVSIGPTLAILDEAKAQGFEILFSVGPLFNGKTGLISLKVVKEY